eukprot:scaffold48295_cov77-Phaeocystis_antarctica.AAC.2
MRLITRAPRCTPVITLTPSHALDESTQGLRRPGRPHEPLEARLVLPLLIAAHPEPQDEAQPEPSAAMQRVEVPQADWGAPAIAWSSPTLPT